MDLTGVFQLPQGLGLGMVLLIIIIVIAVDTILGILQSLKDDAFDWGKLAKFFKTGVLPYVGGILVLALAAYLADLYFMPIFYIVGTVIVAKYGGEIIQKIQMLFSIKKFLIKEDGQKER